MRILISRTSTIIYIWTTFSLFIKRLYRRYLGQGVVIQSLGMGYVSIGMYNNIQIINKNNYSLCNIIIQ